MLPLTSSKWGSNT